MCFSGRCEVEISNQVVSNEQEKLRMQQVRLPEVFLSVSLIEYL